MYLKAIPIKLKMIVPTNGAASFVLVEWFCVKWTFDDGFRETQTLRKVGVVLRRILKRRSKEFLVGNLIYKSFLMNILPVLHEAFWNLVST